MTGLVRIPRPDDIRATIQRLREEIIALEAMLPVSEQWWKNVNLGDDELAKGYARRQKAAQRERKRQGLPANPPGRRPGEQKYSIA